MLSRQQSGMSPPLPKEEMDQEAPESLDKDELLDQDVASAALFQGLLSEQGLDALGRAFNSPEPAKAVAMLIFNVIEPAQVASMDTDTPLSPRVWLAQGGAVDELIDELADLADLFGMDEEQVLDMTPILKQEIAAILQKRGQDIQAQGSQAQQGPAPMAPQPQQGVV